jgi:putative ABC transport system permease protein
MLRNYFKIALRNIWKSKTFSLINFIGLSSGMSLGLLVILIIKDQYSFDSFHHERDRIYRVNTLAVRVNGGIEPYASAPLPLAAVIKDEYSFAEQVVRINRQIHGDAHFENVTVPVSGFFTDPSFFDVFNFKAEKGNPVEALSSPDGLVITQQAAARIFGRTDPIGKTVEIRGLRNFVVKAVLSEFPAKTHLEFEVLGSMLAVPLLEKQDALIKGLEDWTNYYMGYVYFRVKKNRTLAEINAALGEISKKYYTGLKLETRDKGYAFQLHPLRKISPGPELSNQMGRALPSEVSFFLGVLSVVIMLMAGLNYTNLTVARSLMRAREIGVRKVMGARRSQVFLQFVGESVVFSVLSCVLAYLILLFLKSAFLQLHITREFSINLDEDSTLYILFLLFAVIVGTLSGLFPASYLSGFNPLAVLKNISPAKLNTRQLLRKSLMVLQFTLSLVFIAGVLMLYSQIRFMLSADYGINEKNIMNISLQGNDPVKLSSEILNVPGVKRIGAVSHSLGTFQDFADDYRRNIGDAAFVMRDFRADAHYLENIGVRFVAGRNFSSGLPADREREVILNERAVQEFGFADPHTAIGKTIIAGDSLSLIVNGVVRDFHFRPMNYEIGPLAFRYRPADFNLLSVSFEGKDKTQLLAAIEPIWRKIDPVHPIRAQLMEEEIDNAYTVSGFNDILKIMGYVCLLSIIIACMGMLGMVIYSTQIRTKEISIRKVMGAGVKDITLLLSRSFILLVGIGMTLGIPLSYMLGNFFLQNYAYRVSNGPWMILVGVFIIGILGLITVCTQTIKAAMSNPVRNLRME